LTSWLVELARRALVKRSPSWLYELASSCKQGITFIIFFSFYALH